jgi:osmotically-inducible protein OsmY
MQALISEQDLSAERIEIESRSGEVTLRGEVRTFSLKLKAAETAKACDGVTGVVNQLTVIPTEIVSDLKIAFEVNRALAEKANLKEHAIRVDVNAGTVTLSGYAASEQMKTRAEDITLGVPGVLRVSNFLIVNADCVLRNHEVSLTILSSIRRIIGIEDVKINLTTVDEMARLSGTVDAAWQCGAIETVVREFGIIKICNEIVVRK